MAPTLPNVLAVDALDTVSSPLLHIVDDYVLSQNELLVDALNTVR